MNEVTYQFEIENNSERAFGITFSIVFVIISIYPVMSGNSLRLWALIAAALILIIAVLVPQLLKLPNKLWFHFGLRLGSFVSQIVMFFLFFLVLLPTGLIVKLFHVSSVGYRQGSDPRESTYWVMRDGLKNPTGSMRDQF